MSDDLRRKYSKRWFEQEFLADYIRRKQAGLPVEERFPETPLATVLDQLNPERGD